MHRINRINRSTLLHTRSLLTLIIGLVALVGGFVLAQTPSARAAMQQVGILAAPTIPATFNYQGYLRNADGSLMNDTVNVTARIYSAAAGGSALHTETFNSVNVRDGLFNIVLGDSVGLGNTFNAAPRYIGIAINSEPELIPRERVHGVPWAIHATSASVAGQADHADTASQANSAFTADFASSANSAQRATFLGGMEVQYITADATSIDTNKTVDLPPITDDSACFLSTSAMADGYQIAQNPVCLIDPDGETLTAGARNLCMAVCLTWNE